MTFKIVHPFRMAAIFGFMLLIVILLANHTFRVHKALPNPLQLLPISLSNITTKSNTALRDSIVNFGKTLLGTPYLTASCNKDGFDCSGFVFYVFQHFKIAVPRSSIEFNNFGKTVAIDSAKIGDVVVFLSPTKNVIGHVGIITLAKGIESEFIHASSGDEMKVIISSLKQIGYRKRFVKVVDVMPHPLSPSP